MTAAKPGMAAKAESEQGAAKAPAPACRTRPNAPWRKPKSAVRAKRRGVSANSTVAAGSIRFATAIGKSKASPRTFERSPQRVITTSAPTLTRS